MIILTNCEPDLVPVLPQAERVASKTLEAAGAEVAAICKGVSTV